MLPISIPAEIPIVQLLRQRRANAMDYHFKTIGWNIRTKVDKWILTRTKNVFQFISIRNHDRRPATCPIFLILNSDSFTFLKS